MREADHRRRRSGCYGWPDVSSADPTLVAPEMLGTLVRAFPFPDPRSEQPDAPLAWGGDLVPERLLAAYAQGIFPWYEQEPILWYSPDPRAWLRPGELVLNRTLRKNLRRARFSIHLDRDFPSVIESCARAKRPGQPGTWITPDMIRAYCRLHELGFAHSCEAWQGSELVAGVYGVSLGAAFFGESMFTRRSEASKIALVRLVRQLEAWGFHFLDCQMQTPHMARLGAKPVARGVFLSALERALREPTRCGSWRFDDPSRDEAKRA